MSFPYKTILIVGATSGLGLALADRMVENGMFIIAAGRRKDRLDEFVARHGPKRASYSQFDITNLKGIKSWVDAITSSYPSIDAVVLSPGIQRKLDFTRPNAIDLDIVQQEITTNYIAQISLIAAFLPHLQSQAPKPTAVIPISSGLALVPMPRCANYCATKSALHSLCWSMRAQLAQDEGSKHIRVIEIIPPAVQTELHSHQPDLVEAGSSQIGIPLLEFTNDVWASLLRGEDEILVNPLRDNFGHVEVARKDIFKLFSAPPK